MQHNIMLLVPLLLLLLLLLLSVWTYVDAHGSDMADSCTSLPQLHAQVQ
jgi:hypothetical protein